MTRVIFLLLAPTLIVTFLFFNCTHEPVVPINPIENKVKCDSDTVYFQSQVLPILLSSCAFSGCHDKTSHEEGVILTDYSNVMNSGIITKNNGSNSKIYELLTNSSDDRMPPLPNSALTALQIEMIKKWIDQGAINNKCSACDTSNFKYSSAVSIIIANSCKGCHSGTTPSKGVRLESYSDAKALVNDGRLLKVMNGQGIAVMPPSGKMENCKISTISKWINDGAKNN